MKEKLRKAYRRELQNALKAGSIDWLDKSSQAVNTCIDKMFTAIAKPNLADWLKYNPALKAACKSVGIKSSRELRAIFA